MSGFVQSLDSCWTIILAIAAVGVAHYLRKPRTPLLPPGPAGLPFIGNIADVPFDNHWLKFSELGEVWGDILSLTVFGRTMIVINSVKVAEDLLEVHGTNFSDRPVIQMGGELIGFKNGLSLAQYGNRVRKERKVFQRFFGSQTSISQFTPLLTSEIQRLLKNILAHRGDAVNQIRRTMGAITLRISHGYHILDQPRQDPFLEMVETAGKNFASSTKPAAFLVDIVPALRYWPEWLPGGGFHTTAKMWSKQLNETLEAVYEYVKKETAMGTAESSFASTLIEEGMHADYLIKWAAASIQAGGADTTAAQLEAFLLAMSLYPDVQTTAQKELDAVVGSYRLPQISDRAQLPYITALCKEVFRWHVASPTAIPHRSCADFIYERGEGAAPLLIPKNSLIIPNIWKMTHDPERYANPMVFDPTRFIQTDVKAAEPDPFRICFGFGRRICPGKLLADTAVFMVCSAFLAVFSISKATKNGALAEPALGQTSGTVSHPLPFECSVEPRNDEALRLIQSD
ncbi:cytochrome P450 [Mycena pura]|uniref:Cytochrome P450 n=1 Tax=Mycena pura TaxID=153505 RepID=A0AAD6V1G5_9AGAR|nr:cytochrome P450 [Mycena pura]